MESNFRLTLNNLNSLSGVLTVLHDVAKCTINNLSGKTELRLMQSVVFYSQARGLMAKTLDMLAQKGQFHLSCELQGKLASRGFTDIISRSANGEKDFIAAVLE